MSQTLDELVVKLEADISGLRSSIQTAISDVRGFKNSAEKDTNAFTESVNKARSAVLLLGGSFAMLRFGKELVDAGMSFQALSNRMIAATGDAQVAADAMKFVREESDRLGMNMMTTAESFASFSASALRAGMTLQQTKDVFLAVAEAGTALHLSNEQVKSAFLALEQMASKGTVQMQELKLQLSGAIPGALEIMAKALGKSTQELNQMVEKGQLLASDALPKLGDELHKEFGERAVVSANSAQAAFNRLTNAIFNLKESIASSGLLDLVTKLVELLTKLTNVANTVGGAVNRAFNAVGNTIFKTVFGDKGVEALQKARDRAGERSGENPEGNAAGPANPNYSLAKPGGAIVKDDKAAQRAADMRASLRARVGAMTDGLTTSYDPTNPGQYDMQKALAQSAKQFDEQQKLLEEALKKKAITTQEYNEDSLKNELDYQAKLAQIRQEYRDQTLGNEQIGAEAFLGVRVDLQDKSLKQEGESFSQSISQAAQHNRMFFELDKAARIARALLAARQSVVDAYAFGTEIGGPPLGAVFAGVAAAAQAVNIAAIATASYGGGGGSVSSAGSTAGGVGASMSKGSVDAGTNTVSQKNVNITVQGEFFGASQVRDLVNKLNDFIGDGTVKLNVHGLAT